MYNQKDVWMCVGTMDARIDEWDENTCMLPAVCVCACVMPCNGSAPCPGVLFLVLWRRKWLDDMGANSFFSG